MQTVKVNQTNTTIGNSQFGSKSTDTMLVIDVANDRVGVNVAAPLDTSDLAGVQRVRNATAPVDTDADRSQFWSADQNGEAGNAGLHVRSEGGQRYSFGNRAAFGSGIQLPIVTKTTTYTATLQDHTILCDATGGAFSVTLPTAAAAYNTAEAAGLIVHVKKIDSSANAVTVDGNGSETIDGATTQVITSQWDSASIQSNGTAWYII
jgi:hypothetical protein